MRRAAACPLMTVPSSIRWRGGSASRSDRGSVGMISRRSSPTSARSTRCSTGSRMRSRPWTCVPRSGLRFRQCSRRDLAARAWTRVEGCLRDAGAVRASTASRRGVHPWSGAATCPLSWPRAPWPAMPRTGRPRRLRGRVCRGRRACRGRSAGSRTARAPGSGPSERRLLVARLSRDAVRRDRISVRRSGNSRVPGNLAGLGFVQDFDG